jgi:O-antigen/teichoic acid export membrane protein
LKREFLRDGLIYGGATLLTSLSSILLLSVYTRGLEPAEYGVVEFVTVLQVLIQVLVGLELTQGIARFYGGADTHEEGRRYASTGFWFLVIAYGVACGTLFLAAGAVDAALFRSAVEPGILRAAVVAIYLNVLFYAVRSQLRWELRAKEYAIASLAALVATASLSIYLLLVLRIGLAGVFAALAAGSGTGIVSSLIGLRGTYARIFDTGKLKTMLAFSLPLTVSSLALFAESYSDRFVIRATLGFDDLGVYAAGAKIAAVISLASAGFQLGAAPLIYRNYRRPETPGTLAQLLRFFIGLGLVGVTGLAALSVELLALFATPAYAGAAHIVPLLALATVLASGYIFLPGLTIRNLTSRFAAINISAAVIGITAIGVLAQLFGIIGAAIGALIGASVGFSLHAIFSQRVYPIPLEWWRVALALSVAVAAIALDSTMSQPGPGSLLGRVLVSAIAAGAISLVMLRAEDRATIGRMLGAVFASRRASRAPSNDHRTSSG